MNENNQLVSVILPVRNSQESLRECLESLLAQSYADLEIIAIDDLSKDHSMVILKTYRKIDKKIKVSQNIKRYGLSITLNRGLELAQGRYIIFMNPQDTITKDKIRKQVQYLADHPKIVAVGTQCVYLNDQHKRVGKSYFPTETHVISKTIFTGFAVHNESVLIDRYKLPKDLLRFPLVPNKKFSYTPVFIKLLRYGTIANLEQQLHTHVKQHALLSLQSEVFSYVKLWMQARFVYELRLPLQTLFYPLVR